MKQIGAIVEGDSLYSDGDYGHSLSMEVISV